MVLVGWTCNPVISPLCSLSVLAGAYSPDPESCDQIRTVLSALPLMTKVLSPAEVSLQATW